MTRTATVTEKSLSLERDTNVPLAASTDAWTPWHGEVLQTEIFNRVVPSGLSPN